LTKLGKKLDNDEYYNIIIVIVVMMISIVVMIVQVAVMTITDVNVGGNGVGDDIGGNQYRIGYFI